MDDIDLSLDTTNRGYIHSSLIVGSQMIAGLNQMPILRTSADWMDLLPLYEAQRLYGFETNNCVQFSFLNTLETTANYYGKSMNLSDRFLYWASGCTVNGNTFENCYLGFKRNGCPPEESWIWPEGLNSRLVYGREPTPEVKAEAQKFFNDWDLRTPVYVGNDIDSMKAALQKGPLWFSNGYHCMMIYRIDDRIRIFDTYLDDGGGKGSFPLSYAPELHGVFLVPFTPKTTPMPSTKLSIPQFCRVTVVFPNGLKRFFFKDGKMYYDGDHSTEVDDAWFDNNVNPTTHIFSSAPAMTISRNDWEQFDVVNFRGEAYPYPIN